MVGRIAEYSRSIEGKPRVTFEVDGLDELKGYDELSENEVKEVQKKMKQTYNYLKKHFDNVILENELQWI